MKKRFKYYAKKTHCYTYFSITGNFETKKIIDLLGLKPDKCWDENDLRPDGKPYGFSSLSFGLCNKYDVFVENQMLKTIKPLLKKIEILKEIKKNFDVQYCLEIVPTVRYDEPSPCLAPSQEVMKFCVETETDIDIDLYVSCPEPDDDDVLIIK